VKNNREIPFRSNAKFPICNLTLSYGIWTWIKYQDIHQKTEMHVDCGNPGGEDAYLKASISILCRLSRRS